MPSWIQAKFKTIDSKARLVYSLPLFFLVLLYFTNPKRFEHEELNLRLHNQAINRIERVLQRVETNIFGNTEKARLKNYYLFSVYKQQSSNLLLKKKRVVYLGILRKWFRLGWMDKLPDCSASKYCNFKGLCIRDDQCLCLPGYKSEHCASRISKFQPIMNLVGIPISNLDAYLLLSIAMTVVTGLRNLHKLVTKSSYANYADFILNHFESPNFIHYMYALFMYHKYAPVLYSVIGSRNFACFILSCHCMRLASLLTTQRLISIKSSSALSLINLTSILLLNQLKNGPMSFISTEVLSEYIRYISIDILLSLNLNSFWIGIQSVICTSALLKYIL